MDENKNNFNQEPDHPIPDNNRETSSDGSQTTPDTPPLSSEESYGNGWQSAESTPNSTASSDQPPSAGQSYQAPPPNQNPEYQWKFADYDKISNAGQGNKPKNNTGLKIFSVVISIVFVLTAASFVGFILFNKYTAANEASLSENSESVMSGPDIALNNRPSPEDEKYTEGVLSTEEIAAKVRPSVVGIVTYNMASSLQATGAGSGIVMSSDGYILTNAHVVSGATGIVVVLDNNEEYEATIVGIDERTDIAVIKIEVKNLTAAEFGNSEELVVGERIVAIGNPTGLNLAGSTTQGIVSGLRRNITLQGEDGTPISMEAIQVDAAINPGNSGGALINKYGQVVGINSSKLMATQIEGIGFAIPIESAKPIFDDLIKYGYVKGRVLLGISYYPVSEVVAEMTGYAPGLLVQAVNRDMDVYAKGIRVGDIITQMDGKKITTTEELRKMMDGKKPGDSIKLQVYRASPTGKKSTFTVDVQLSEDKGNRVVNPVEQQEQTPELQFPFMQLP